MWVRQQGPRYVYDPKKRRLAREVLSRGPMSDELGGLCESPPRVSGKLLESSVPHKVVNPVVVRHPSKQLEPTRFRRIVSGTPKPLRSRASPNRARQFSVSQEAVPRLSLERTSSRKPSQLPVYVAQFFSSVSLISVRLP